MGGRTGEGTAVRSERTNLAPRTAVATGLVAKSAEAATLLVLVTVVPRTIGPADYGVFALALSLVTIVSGAISVGGAQLFARFVPAARPAERKPVARALGVGLARRRAPLTALAVVAALVLATLFPDTFPPLPTALVALAVVLDVAATLCFQLALGLGRYRAWSLRYPVQNGALTVAAVVLATAWGATGALVAVVVGAGAAFVMGVIVGALPLRGAETADAVPGGAVEFARYHSVNSVLLLLAHRGTIVVVALFAGARETGYAALAIGVGLAALYAVHQIFLLQLAELSEQADDDVAAAERHAGRLAAQALVVLGAAALVGAVALDPLVTTFFGPEFAGARTAFVPILALLPLIPLAAVGTQLVSLRLEPRPLVAASTAGLGVVLVTAPAGTIAWGAVGGPASLLACTVAFVTVLSVTTDGLTKRRLYVPAGACSAVALAIGLGVSAL